MPPVIIPQFSTNARKSNQFYLHEIEKMLCPAPCPEDRPRLRSLALDSAMALEKDGNSYTFDLRKDADGKILSLDATLVHDKVIYKTRMKAVLVRENLFEINELVFDNKTERTDCRYEIENILGHIGHHMLSRSCAGEIPLPHKEKGKFGKIGRFFHRIWPEDFGSGYISF